MDYFFDRCFDKKRLKQLLVWFHDNEGEKKTLRLLENLKKIGFFYSTQSGLSIGIEDLQINLKKSKSFKLTEFEIQQIDLNYRKSNLTQFEYFQQLVEIWAKTNQQLKLQIIENFQLKNQLNPLFLMAFSGARGNISQVRQLVGMRGLMSDPQGQILDFPIRSNFREGLTLTEYIISCYGARKGIVDTALRTATSGYLTRRLVDVAQHVIIEKQQCESTSPIWISDLMSGKKVLLPLKQRLIGRVLGKKMIAKNLKKKFLKNTQITSSTSGILANIFSKIPIRSPLTCISSHSICQYCYGWNLSTQSIVSLGEAVGVLAAQSIGEPGTQLTMRTFHTGGVFSGGVVEQMYSPIAGQIFYTEKISGNLIRTLTGKIAFLTKQSNVIILKSFQQLKLIFKIPRYSLLFLKNKQAIRKKQLVAELSSNNPLQSQQIYSEKDLFCEHGGQILFENLVVIEKKKPNGEIKHYTQHMGTIWILSAKYFESFWLIKLFPYNLDLINSNVAIQKIQLNIDEFAQIPVSKKLGFNKNSQTEEFFLTIFQNLDTNLIVYKKQYYFLNDYFQSVRKYFHYRFFKATTFRQLGYCFLSGISLICASKFNQRYFFAIQHKTRNNNRLIRSFDINFRVKRRTRLKIFPQFLKSTTIYSFWYNRIVLNVYNFENFLKKNYWKNYNFKNRTANKNQTFGSKQSYSKTQRLDNYQSSRMIFAKSLPKITPQKSTLCFNKYLQNPIFLSQNPYFQKFYDLWMNYVLKKQRSFLSDANHSQSPFNYIKDRDSILDPKIVPQTIGARAIFRWTFLNRLKNHLTKTLDKQITASLSNKASLLDERQFEHFDVWLTFSKIGKRRVSKLGQQQILEYPKPEITQKLYNLQYVQLFNPLMHTQVINLKKKYFSKIFLFFSKKTNFYNFKSRFKIQRKLDKTIFILKFQKFQYSKNDNQKKNNKKSKYIHKKFLTSYFCKNQIRNFAKFRIMKTRTFEHDFFQSFYRFNSSKIVNMPKKSNVRLAFFGFENLYKKQQITDHKNFINQLRLFVPKRLNSNLTNVLEFKNKLKFRFLKSVFYRKMFLMICVASTEGEFFTDEPVLISSKISKSRFPSCKFTILQKTNLLKFQFPDPHFGNLFLGNCLSPISEIGNQQSIISSGQIYQISKKNILCRRASSLLLTSNGILHIQNGSLVEANTRLFTMFYSHLKTGDIVQGIPKIEEFFEARQTRSGNPLFENLHIRLQYLYNKYKIQYKHSKAVKKALLKLQQIVVNEIQFVYTTQGIFISDKHIEIVIRQMTSKVRVLDGGSTGLLRGELIDLLWIEKINQQMKLKLVKYEPIILGITKTCLETNSFISAASFQETTRILTKAAIHNRMDFICGLKENVILGHLIPAGTGFIAF